VLVSIIFRINKFGLRCSQCTTRYGLRCSQCTTRCEQFLSVDNRRCLDYRILPRNKFHWQSHQTEHVDGECDHIFTPHEPDRGPAAWLEWIIEELRQPKGPPSGEVNMRRQHSDLVLSLLLFGADLFLGQLHLHSPPCILMQKANSLQ